MRLRGERGQVVVEYAIVFPIQLLVTLAIIQIAHIFVAKSLVSYAAFCGARAALVDEDAEDAAAIAMSGVAGTAGAELEENITVPGWGELPRSGGARLKNEVEVIEKTDEDGIPIVTCNVAHLYQLTIPIGNYLTYQIGRAFLPLPDIDETYGEPHFRVTGTSTLVRPWETANVVGEEEF